MDMRYIVLKNNMKIDLGRMTYSSQESNVSMGITVPTEGELAASVSSVDGDVVLRGVAAPLNVETERIPGLLYIKFAPGAFTRTLRDGSDYRGFEGHNHSHLLSRHSAGTMEMYVHNQALRYVMNIGDPALSERAREIEYRVGRNELNSVSIGFGLYPEAMKDYDSFKKAVTVEEREDGALGVTYNEVLLYESSVVSIAQYDEETSIEQLLDAANETEESVIDESLKRLHRVQIERYKFARRF